MPRKSPYQVLLSPEQRTKLETIARSYTSPYCDVIRAKIALYAADGLDNDQIAARLDTARQIVSKGGIHFPLVGITGLVCSRPAGGMVSGRSAQLVGAGGRTIGP